MDRILFFLIGLWFVWIDDNIFAIGSSEVHINGNITAEANSNDIKLECSFSLGEGDAFYSTGLTAENATTDKFIEIAGYLKNTKPLFTPFGMDLFGNKTTSIHFDENQNMLTFAFDDLKCRHERRYKCLLFVTSSISVLPRGFESNAIWISVTVQPSAPEAVTLMNLSMSTTSIITDGDTITLVCSGDVGKPPGKFRFQHFRSGHILYKNYTSTSTSLSEILDNCSYYRTSYITLQITSEDNKAVMRCVVESPLSEISMFVDSEPLEVFYAVKMPTIVKLPTKTDYLVGIDTSISLKCNTDGNPKPSYVWYTDNTVESLSTSENLTITDVSTISRCIYTCFVSNALNAVTHTKRVQMHVCDGEGSENTAVIVLGTVCGSIILVLCLVLFGIMHNKIKSLHMRNLNDRSLDYVNALQQHDLSLYESVGNVLDVHHYEQPSTGEHQFTNTNLSGSVGHALDVHHYEQPSTGEHQYTNTSLSGN